jgi:hypothetical protein
MPGGHGVQSGQVTSWSVTRSGHPPPKLVVEELPQHWACACIVRRPPGGHGTHATYEPSPAVVAGTGGIVTAPSPATRRTSHPASAEGRPEPAQTTMPRASTLGFGPGQGRGGAHAPQSMSACSR